MAASESTPKIRLFYSYAHEDEEFRDQLEKHLKLLAREGLIQEWHDRNLGAGTDWEGEISKNLEAAKLILLLISPDFLASDYSYEIEMKLAMEKHHAGEARVIPIILRNCDWHSAPFSKLQALPKDAKPITSWTDQDSAWTDVAKGIRKAIEQWKADQEREIAFLDRIKPQRFDKDTMTLEDYREGAEILLDIIDRRDSFDPEIIIAVNQGGMVVAAVMNKRWRRPVGVVYVASVKGKKVIKAISLPCEVGPSTLSESETPGIKLQPSRPKRILVVDPKLKTGDSAEKIQELLLQAYGQDQDIDIRFAIVLGCDGWKPSRWKVIYHSAYEWPILFKPKNLEVYVAYYTDSSQVVEEIRSGVRIPAVRSQ